MYFALPVANTYRQFQNILELDARIIKKYPKSIPWESNVMKC